MDTQGRRHIGSPRMNRGWAPGAIALLSACAWAQTPPSPNSPGEPAGKVEMQTTVAPAETSTPAQTTPVGKYANAGELLTALETADAKLRSLQASVLWTKKWALGGDDHIRRGTLFYADERHTAPPTPTTPGTTPSEPKNAPPQQPGVQKFAVEFTQLVIGDRDEREIKQYIFDGSQLVEKDPGSKKMIRQQFQRDGLNPLKIGEGPMPLPIGQKKSDIESRFDAQLLPAGDGLDDDALKAFAAGAYQLRLTPKPGVTDTGNLRLIRLWYLPDEKTGALIPRMAWTEDGNQDQSIVQLVNVKTNTNLSQAFDTAAPPDWEVQLR